MFSRHVRCLKAACVGDLCLLVLLVGGDSALLRAQSADSPPSCARASAEFSDDGSLVGSTSGSVSASEDAKGGNSRPENKSSTLMNDASVGVAKPVPPPEGFHFWRATLQSFEFTMASHAIRVATDGDTANDLAHRPYFHDWFVSYQGWDFHRWGDGDDFIVNDVGHPLQGAVFSRFFLQNSPRGRGAVIGKNRDYWISRLNSMAWSAVWEFQWKLGPFSETSIGNAGGYLYYPPDSHKPPTNNTGWTDLVITPVLGVVWVMGEDTLEKYVVEPVARNHRILGGKILRSALEPSKAFAALFMGKLVWQLPNAENNYTMPTKSSHPPLDNGESGPPLNHWEIGTQYTNITLPVVTHNCLNCRQYNSGTGFTFDWNPARSFGLDSSVNFFPGQGGASPMIEGLFGAKLGHRWHSWGLFGKVRPGFIYYENAAPRLGLSDTRSLTRFASDFGIIAEVYASRHSTLRFDVGTTLVRYLSDRPEPPPPLPSLLSNQLIVTQGNFQLSAGYVYRF